MSGEWGRGLVVPRSPGSKTLNEKHRDGIWGKVLYILGRENTMCDNLPFLISHGGSYKTHTQELKCLQCPGHGQQQRKLLVH